MKKCLAVFLCLVASTVLSQDDFIVCRQARSMFSCEDRSRPNVTRLQGPSGKRGPKGEKGNIGSVGPVGRKGETGSVDYDQVQKYIDDRARAFTDCEAIMRHNGSSSNGLYDIKDEEGSVYRTYCDMTTDEGGWTLVASVHENYLQGKCTVGDRWSSEQGNNANHPHGDGAWENTAIFGAPEAASSDDYKNPGFFNMVARDIMIWHVPNMTPVKEYKNRAFMMYHTTTGILGNYGGNLYTLFKDHYPLRSGTYQKSSGNGPFSPIVWDRGNNAMMVDNTPPSLRVQVTPGYIQFRAINNEGGAYAICPGVKFKPGYGDVEHCCVGGTSNQGHVNYCGDFGAFDWSGYGTGTGASATREMTESVVMIFYR